MYIYIYIYCRVFRDFPFPLIAPFHCDALQNQHSSLRHRGERAPSAGFFRHSTYGPSCPLQIMCHKSPKKNTKIARVPRTPKCLGAVVLAHPGRVRSNQESCKNIPNPYPIFRQNPPTPYLSCCMISRVRSVMVVSLFGRGGM